MKSGGERVTGFEPGVSEVVSVIVLIGIAVGVMGLVSLALIAGPPPTAIPSISGLVSIGNCSHTIFISHEGGESLSKGQYQIFLDGVDRTSFFGSNSPEPWSQGKVLNYTPSTMPKQMVMVSNRSWGGGTVLISANLTKMVSRCPTFVRAAASSSASVTLPGPSTTGDFIVVSFYWQPQTSGVSSVTDTKGNTYYLAVGPTNWGGTSYRGATYYSSNINGGGPAITITVTYSPAISGTQSYAAEYSGVAPVNPLDQVSAQSGTGTVLNSGPVATRQDTELVYGFAMSEGTATVNPPLTPRSTFSNNFIADQTVIRRDYYSVTGANSGGAWLCQMATFTA